MVGFEAVFTDITRRELLFPEKVSIHKAKVTAIKVVVKQIHKRWAIKALCIPLVQQRKSLNIKSDV